MGRPLTKSRKQEKGLVWEGGHRRRGLIPDTWSVSCPTTDISEGMAGAGKDMRCWRRAKLKVGGWHWRAEVTGKITPKWRTAAASWPSPFPEQPPQSRANQRSTGQPQWTSPAEISLFDAPAEDFSVHPISRAVKGMPTERTMRVYSLPAGLKNIKVSYYPLLVSRWGNEHSYISGRSANCYDILGHLLPFQNLTTFDSESPLLRIF